MKFISTCTCPKHSQMFTKFNSMHCWPTTFTMVNSCIVVQEHSQTFTNLISTYFLPRTFTNVHKVYFHTSLAQNIHKCSQSLFPHVSCPEHSQMFTKFISTRLLPRTFTNVHKVYFHTSLAQNIHKCSQSLFPHVSCPEHSQMFTKFISTRLLPRTFTNVHKVYFHTSLAHVEVKIYSWTDIFLDPRLQRSKRGNNSARSSEQQDMQVLGWFMIPETIVVCRDKNHVQKYIVKQCLTFCRLLWKGLALPLALWEQVLERV